ncbi:hypothetical protein RF679_07910 [Undibacterium cyanobacteriorum]|uniref:DUF2306 domain-containing protein n=1 Tax=Undibacterium cyanobacteriorum TaxID=3073561 RepID=A0ABY9RQE0_9BURK|nr:hypothetical protein [Undibacterium sp. 20NA77.5]WMW82196.1 hypothetical protein RF679_07910 [Undibacterium sp. 20NA77.5]
MKWIHIMTGLIAIASGFFALYATKGSAIHRKSGIIFTLAMLSMSLSAAIISLFLRPDHVTGVVALFTAYLICTSWLVVRRTVQESRVTLEGLALAAAVLGVYSLNLWLDFTADPKSLITKNSPPQVLLVFGSISLLCATADIRMIWAGEILGSQRLMRHLWRMCFAMLIATGSFFTGQMQVFPSFIRKSSVFGIPTLAIPVLLVVITTIYWILCTFIKRKRTKPKVSIERS